MARKWLCGDFSCPLCYQQPGGAPKNYQQPVGMSFGRSSRAVAPVVTPNSFGRSFAPPPRAAEPRPLRVQNKKGQPSGWVKDLNKKGQPSGGQEEAVVLSYFHTVSAAAQILKISEESVRKLGESSSDLKTKITSQYGSDMWRQVQDKSLADEKSRKIQERQKELQKQQAKINRVTEKLLESKCDGANKPKPKVAATKKLDANKPQPKPKAASTEKLDGANKPQPKPKAASKPPKAMAANPFLSLFEDSDDDGEDMQ